MRLRWGNAELCPTTSYYRRASTSWLCATYCRIRKSSMSSVVSEVQASPKAPCLYVRCRMRLCNARQLVVKETTTRRRSKAVTLQTYSRSRVSSVRQNGSCDSDVDSGYATTRKSDLQIRYIVFGGRVFHAILAIRKCLEILLFPEDCFRTSW